MVIVMKAVNYSNLRNGLKSYMDMINDTFETLVVTRKNGQNVIMMSEDTYNNIMENAYLRASEANYKWLMESKAQVERRKTIRKDIADL
jgi:antitoxin YefM